MGKATPIMLSAKEKKTLLSWVRSGKTERRMSERAEIILAASEGQSNLEIAKRLATRPARISKWRTRFAKNRLSELTDAP